MLVVCGPWIGEIAGEVENWTPWLRAARHKRCPTDDFVCVGYPGRQVLYEFASEFWPIPDSFAEMVNQRIVFPRWDTVVDARSNQLIKDTGCVKELHDWLTKETGIRSAGRKVLTVLPGSEAATQAKEGFPAEREFKLIRATQTVTLPEGKLISIFPRNRLNETWRNWTAGLPGWQKLIQALVGDGYLVTAHGSAADSMILGPSTDRFINCVGKSLDEQIAYLQRSVVAVTPICGAIRLAASVGIPTVTFGDLNYINEVARAEGKPLSANPFNTPLHALARPWCWEYPPDEVKAFTYGVIRGLK